MAILTYDPSAPDQPEFNEAEQEALARGEAQAAEESRLLAGKYEDAEALEQAREKPMIPRSRPRRVVWA